MNKRDSINFCYSVIMPLVFRACLILFTSALSNLTSRITSSRVVGVIPLGIGLGIGDRSEGFLFLPTRSSGL